MFILLLSRVWGLAYITEEELLEYSDVVVDGEIVSSECLSSSIDAEGNATSQFEAVISIETLVKGDIQDAELTLVTNQFVRSEDASESFCDWTDVAHPIGEVGTYYLIDSDGVYELYTQGFIVADNSNPSNSPECPSLEENTKEIEEDEMTEGGCNHEPSVPFSFFTFAFLIAFLRRNPLI
jgi:hypothetical protein